ncbi:hypothetical protein OXX80_000352 [Metschnikowia pulcherrima]
MHLSRLTTLCIVVTLVHTQEFGISYQGLETLSVLPQLQDLTNQEICDALCHAPTDTAFYYFYEADMLVLRQVLRGLRIQRRCLVKLLRMKQDPCARGKEKFAMLTEAFAQLSHAFQGVDAEFLIKFNAVARAYGLKSPVDMKHQIVALSRDVTELGKQWRRQCREELIASAKAPEITIVLDD